MADYVVQLVLTNWAHADPSGIEGVSSQDGMSSLDTLRNMGKRARPSGPAIGDSDRLRAKRARVALLAQGVEVIPMLTPNVTFRHWSTARNPHHPIVTSNEFTDSIGCFKSLAPCSSRYYRQNHHHIILHLLEKKYGVPIATLRNIFMDYTTEFANLLVVNGNLVLLDLVKLRLKEFLSEGDRVKRFNLQTGSMDWCTRLAILCVANGFDYRSGYSIAHVVEQRFLILCRQARLLKSVSQPKLYDITWVASQCALRVSTMVG
jgi:hypothetical protein